MHRRRAEAPRVGEPIRISVDTAHPMSSFKHPPTPLCLADAHAIIVPIGMVTLHLLVFPRFGMSLVCIHGKASFRSRCISPGASYQRPFLSRCCFEPYRIITAADSADLQPQPHHHITHASDVKHWHYLRLGPCLDLGGSNDESSLLSISFSIVSLAPQHPLLQSSVRETILSFAETRCGIILVNIGILFMRTKVEHH